MYYNNTKFEEELTKLIDENDNELKEVNKLLDLALTKLEISREELEHELLMNDYEQKINELVKEINVEYDNVECIGKNCLECEYGRSESCETKFAVKKLIEKGMLKL